MSVRPWLPRSPKLRAPAFLGCVRALYLTCFSLPAPAESPWELRPQPDPRVGVVRRLGEVNQWRRVNVMCVGWGQFRGYTHFSRSRAFLYSFTSCRREGSVSASSARWLRGLGEAHTGTEQCWPGGHLPLTSYSSGLFPGAATEQRPSRLTTKAAPGACPLALAPAPFHSPTQGPPCKTSQRAQRELEDGILLPAPHHGSLGGVLSRKHTSGARETHAGPGSPFHRCSSATSLHSRVTTPCLWCSDRAQMRFVTCFVTFPLA